MELPLTNEDKNYLKNLHRSLKDKRKADRIKIVIMLDNGFSVSQIVESLMLDEDTVTKWKKKFQVSNTIGEFMNYQYTKYEGRLDEQQIANVKHFVNEQIIFDSKQVIQFINEQYGIFYSQSGIISLLHKIGFSFKQLTRFNSKATVELQEEFISKFQNIQKNIKNTDSIVFLDAVHPQHNSKKL